MSPLKDKHMPPNLSSAMDSHIPQCTACSSLFPFLRDAPAFICFTAAFSFVTFIFCDATLAAGTYLR